MEDPQAPHPRRVGQRRARGRPVTVKEELGLPHAAGLTADLHSFLVYEPNQFFLAHQDSEKDDSMVGTLVVTLPSSYAGGS